MFNEKNDIQEFEKKRKLDLAMLKIVEGIMLNSDMPEDKKMAVRLLSAQREVTDAMHDALPAATLTSDSINIENGKKICFFLHTVAEQIKAFSINNPIGAEVGGENA